MYMGRGGAAAFSLLPGTHGLFSCSIYSFILSNGSIQPRLRTTENSSSVKGSLFFLNLQTLTQTVFLWLNTFFFKDFSSVTPSLLNFIMSKVTYLPGNGGTYTLYMCVYEYIHTHTHIFIYFFQL